MFFVGVISEALLYLCFSMVLASLIFQAVPNSRKPDIVMPKRVVMSAVAGIVFFSFIPILQVVLFLLASLGIGQALQSVLFTFEVGKTWIFTVTLSGVLFFFLLISDLKKNVNIYIGITLTIIIMLGIGWSSHAGSINRFTGVSTHTLHFFAVCTWVGLVIVAGWFSKGTTNWLSFLKWFSPVALVCFLATGVSGMILMSFVMDFSDYANAWMVPYGQSLLIKHVLIIPLVIFAVINGIFVKRKLKRDASYDPRPWVKVEGFILLIIFAVTAALNQQSPPHNITALLKGGDVSDLFHFFHGHIQADSVVDLVMNPMGITLLCFSVIFLLLTVFSFIKKLPAPFTFFIVILLVFSGYVGLMLSVTVK